MGCQFKVLDAVLFSCQRRKRMWWTNFRWGRFQPEEVHLSSCLLPRTGEAKFKKVATITTKSQSLKQNNKCNKI